VSRDSPLIYLIAGEPSGDALGANLMAALTRRSGGTARFAGIGGEQMAALGLQSLFPIDDLAVIGVAEVLPRAVNILRRVKQAVADIQSRAPDVLVTIDSSGFNWRVAQRLRGAHATLPILHYVAPMVWAWRAGRAARMARWYDQLMTLLPFEPPYFTKVGLATAYVGHPVVEMGADRGDGAAFRRRHGIAADAKAIAVLPGSRRGEVRTLLPIFAATLSRLSARYPGLVAVVPVPATVVGPVTTAAVRWPVRSIVLRGPAEKYDGFAACDVALAASGTVAVELALARVPSVVTYRVNRLTHALVRRIVKIDHAHLLNLILGRQAVPELLQQDCTPDKLAAAVAQLLDDRAAAAAQISACREALQRLGLGELSPGLRAADAVLAWLGRISDKAGNA
jgi:lipid-A-disaccharide synthase